MLRWVEHTRGERRREQPASSAAPTDAKATDAKAMDSKAMDATAMDAKATDAKAMDATAMDATAITSEAAPPVAGYRVHDIGYRVQTAASEAAPPVAGYRVHGTGYRVQTAASEAAPPVGSTCVPLPVAGTPVAPLRETVSVVCGLHPVWHGSWRIGAVMASLCERCRLRCATDDSCNLPTRGRTASHHMVHFAWDPANARQLYHKHGGLLTHMVASEQVGLWLGLWLGLGLWSG